MPESVTPHELAMFGGGCFWCIEAVFQQLRGVDSVTSGYAGGSVDHPTYEQVCTGKTGHAEVVQIAFDPAIISFDELLDVFFAIHDPTSLNRQGGDVGTQYRSVIFCRTAEQKDLAQRKIAQLTDENIWPAPIVTELAADAPFFAAETYHQGYFRDNGRQPYCQAVVAPKVAKFRSKFAEKLKG